jgi:phospholipase C
VAINYVVVLMLENRSYDNILGRLYGVNNAPPFTVPPPGQAGLDGLTGNEANPNPFYGSPQALAATSPAIPVTNQTLPTQIGGTGRSYPATCIPAVDPGEYFGDMAQQILSTPGIAQSNPWASYSPAYSGLMQGFVANYATPFGLGQPAVPPSNVADVMNGFSPAQLPVTSFLANNFAVCDQWFASVPTQTYTNRVFALTGGPGMDSLAAFSFVDDDQYVVTDSGSKLDFTTLTSIFYQLDQVLTNPPNWKVYFHDYSIAMRTISYVQTQGALKTNVNVSTFDDTDWGSSPDVSQMGLGQLPNTFVADIAAGTLPSFSFIEPRYGTYNVPPETNAPPNPLPANSNHPGAGYGNVSASAPPIDVTSGELLLMTVYNLLSGWTSWDETLLIVTYDEHGGIYDHVPPPLAMPPGSSVPAAQNNGIVGVGQDPAANGFGFNVLGGRVPAILISPCIAPSSTIRASVPFDHTSIIKTLYDVFGLTTTAQPFLTQRDSAAPSLVPYLSPAAVNPAGPYAATIVCGPSSLAFDGAGTFVAFASAGSATLSAAVVSASGASGWLSIAAAPVANMPSTASVLQITVTTTIPTGMKAGSYNGAIQVTGTNLAPAVIPVTLTVPAS